MLTFGLEKKTLSWQHSSNVISVGGVCSKTIREASKVTKLILSIDEDESLICVAILVALK